MSLAQTGGSRSRRKGQYSCDFCKLRKLRCDRPLPCTNCVSRRRECHFRSATGQRPTRVPQEQQQQQQSSVTDPSLSLSASSNRPRNIESSAITPAVPSSIGPNRENLLEEVQSLRRIVVDLESRVIQSETSNQDEHQSPLSSDQTHVEVGQSVLQSPPSSPRLEHVKELALDLERMSLAPNVAEPPLVHDFAIKLEFIRNIPSAAGFIVQNGNNARLVCLPVYTETMLIVDKFIVNLGFIYPFIHPPSLLICIDDLYQQIQSQRPVELGQLMLLLSIIAHVCEAWTSHEGLWGKNTLFVSENEATSQSALWIKATMDTMSNKYGPPVSLEAAQAITIATHVVNNTEGFSVNYRLLNSASLLLSRELELHRIDHKSKAATANTVRAELGRRVWWYNVTTDWLLAAAFGGPSVGMYQVHPQHMTTNKPRNINDVDLVEGGPRTEEPLSNPTDMAYLLERIRLVEIIRLAVDQNLIPINFDKSEDPTPIKEFDSQIDGFLRDLPACFDISNCDTPELMSSETSEMYARAAILMMGVHLTRCMVFCFVKRSPSKTPAYGAARKACVKSARGFIQSLMLLNRGNHPMALIWPRFTQIRHGILISCMVLLTDAYIEGSETLQNEIYHGDVANVLHIVGEASSQCWAAHDFYVSLMQMLAKYTTREPYNSPKEAQDSSSSAPISDSSYANPTHARDTITAQTPSHPDQLRVISTPREANNLNGLGMPARPFPLQFHPQYDNSLPQGQYELGFSNTFWWENTTIDLPESHPPGTFHHFEH